MSLNKKGNEAFSNGDYSLAIMYYTLALRDGTTDPVIKANLLVADSRYQFEQGYYRAAIASMKMAINRFGRNGPIAMKWYTDILNRQDCERRKDCSPIKDGDFDPVENLWSPGNEKSHGKGYVLGNPWSENPEEFDKWLAADTPMPCCIHAFTKNDPAAPWNIR